MTTIVANREMIAADSLTANEDGTVISRATQKIVRIYGDIIGCEGDDAFISQFLDWYAAGRKPEDRPDGMGQDQFGAIVLTADGELVKYFHTCYPVPHNGEWLTMGAGADIALGALAMGATPEEAVEIACRLNIWTGPPVVVERLEP